MEIPKYHHDLELIVKFILNKAYGNYKTPVVGQGKFDFAEI